MKIGLFMDGEYKTKSDPKVQDFYHELDKLIDENPKKAEAYMLRFILERSEAENYSGSRQNINYQAQPVKKNYFQRLFPDGLKAYNYKKFF